MTKCSLAAALVLVSAFGLVAVRALTGNRKLEGSAKISICGKFADGSVGPLDSIDIPNLSLKATVLEVLTRKEVQTDFSFGPKASARGRQISVRLTGPAKLESNLISGEVPSLELPVEITVDRTSKFNTVLKLTTGNAKSTTGGVISGHPMNINHVAHTATLKMVGNADFKGRAFDDAIATYRRSAGAQAKLPSEIFLVIESQGSAAIIGQ
jgi:hypothetical protein